MSNCCCCIEKDTKRVVECPTCKRMGQQVEKVTVMSLLKEDYAKDLEEGEKYFLCTNPICNTVYYTDGGKVFSKDQVKVRVGFKETEEPILVCYCSNVTKKNIQEAVWIQGAKTLKEVVKTTGAMIKNDCLHNNPKGACCSTDIKQVMQEALSQVD